MKLKYKDIAPTRHQRLELQSFRCALCEDLIEHDAVLDHDHKTGRLRAVLHRGCNAMLGKIENNMPKNLITIDRLEVFSQNLIKYLQQEYEDVVHPTYLTKEERAMKAYKKKKKKSKTKKY